GGGVRYGCKGTRRPEKKAELQPVGFRGRLFGTSRGFVAGPVKRLMRLARDASPSVPAASSERCQEPLGIVVAVGGIGPERDSAHLTPEPERDTPGRWRAGRV